MIKTTTTTTTTHHLVSSCKQSNHTWYAFSFAFYSLRLFEINACYYFSVPDKPVSREPAIAHLNKLLLKSFWQRKSGLFSFFRKKQSSATFSRYFQAHCHLILWVRSKTPQITCNGICHLQLIPKEVKVLYIFSS